MVSWNTMLVGYAQHGFGREASEIYNVMHGNGIKPNGITFLGIPSACGRVWLVEEGWHHFNSMIKDHGIAPRTDHLASLVSLFPRKIQTKELLNSLGVFQWNLIRWCGGVSCPVVRPQNSQKCSSGKIRCWENFEHWSRRYFSSDHAFKYICRGQDVEWSYTSAKNNGIEIKERYRI